MVKAREWPVRVIYLLIAAALVMSLIIVAAPARKASAAPAEVKAEWERVPTPTVDNFVLAPNSTIIDANAADGGEVAYAVITGTFTREKDGYTSSWWLLKSDDHAATWTDLNDALEKVDESDNITAVWRVATDWVDSEFVAVALEESGEVRVYFSIDGGTTFENAGRVLDTLYFNALANVSDLAVSYEAGGKRDIAIGGRAYNGTNYSAGLFRSTVTGDSAAAWEDATDTADYEGWDNIWPTDTDNTNNLASEWVTDIIFSNNWDKDKTILVTTYEVGASDYNVHLQCGSWAATPGWNERSTLGIEAVLIIDDYDIPTFLTSLDARGIAGLLVPEDYNSKIINDRILWVWANYYDPGTGDPACLLARVENDDADPVGPMGQIQDGKVWLTNVSYHGTIAEGEAIAGLLGTGTYDPIGGSTDDLTTACCKGVQVYRNDGIVNMDVCCERWRKACKPPTGRASMAVHYVGEDKAYAVAFQDNNLLYDEGAWSVTFDDGDDWNQLSLIDTCISYLSDIAVSPDCNKIMLVSVNLVNMESPCQCTGCTGCDSVWLYAEEELHEAEEYTGKWLRTWCDMLGGDNSADFPSVPERGLLRLPPEETDGMNVFLFDRMSGNVYWNDLETLACWKLIASTAVTHIVDLAAQDVDTLFALDVSGKVAKYYDDEWHEEVASEITGGWTIAVKGDDILVGGRAGDVSHSAEGGEADTFTELEEATLVKGRVTVAFDSYFDQNDTIYAAIDAQSTPSTGGIYLWVIGESEDWTDIDACNEFGYTGLVLDRPAPGNPMTNAETGGVLYASYYYDDGSSDLMTGVARCLTPIVEICCDVGAAEWDYLYRTAYDTLADKLFKSDDSEKVVGFLAAPNALKICGCLTADSNSKLFAIDLWNSYDMDDGEWGTAWMFEDCYAKKAVDLTAPADGFVVPADPCECDNIPFTLKWDRLCDSCCYEIEFALDEDFTEPVSVAHWYTSWYEDMLQWIFETIAELTEEEIPISPTGGICGMDACWYGSYCPEAPETPSMWVPSDETFTCEFTYYWRVRAVSAETGQCIRSWWSEPQSFAVAPSTVAAAITLVSPEPGTTGIALDNVGFSWNLMASWDAFDWVLDNNADFSSPVDSTTGLTTTAYECTKKLEYNTSYYWQVTAYKDGSAISMSAVGTFRTVTEEEVTPTPIAKTPFWVWVVISIGAVLVIVVIVLIFRTRRV